MEHFSSYTRTLDEISRVLKPDGMLWIAVPNGYSFDDALYRFTDAGHGHVNRFRLDPLIQEVRIRTDLKLVQFFALFSGFVDGVCVVGISKTDATSLNCRQPTEFM